MLDEVVSLSARMVHGRAATVMLPHSPPGFMKTYHPNNTITENAGTRAPQAIAIVSTITSLAAFTVLVRFYTRIRISRFLGTDDWLILVAMVLSFTYMITIIISASLFGYYSHVWNVTKIQRLHYQRVIISLQVILPWAFGSIKLSILFFYLRLSVSPLFRKVVWFNVGVCLLQAMAFSIMMLLQCRPLAPNPNITPKCVNRKALQYTSASLNTLTDLIVLFLSWFLCKDLRVGLRQKIGVFALFSLGIFVCICSGLRISALKSYWTSEDPTWVVFNVSIFTMLEINLGIVTASAPALKPLIVQFSPKFDCKYCKHTSRILSARFRGSARSSKRLSGSEPTFPNDLDQDTYVKQDQEMIQNVPKTPNSALDSTLFSRSSMLSINYGPSQKLSTGGGSSRNSRISGQPSPTSYRASSRLSTLTTQNSTQHRLSTGTGYIAILPPTPGVSARFGSVDGRYDVPDRVEERKSLMRGSWMKGNQAGILGLGVLPDFDDKQEDDTVDVEALNNRMNTQRKGHFEQEDATP